MLQRLIFFQFSGFGPLDPHQQEISTEVQARSASKFFDTNATDSTQSCSTQNDSFWDIVFHPTNSHLLGRF